jgi:hypothetical protein
LLNTYKVRCLRKRTRGSDNPLLVIIKEEVLAVEEEGILNFQKFTRLLD